MKLTGTVLDITDRKSIEAQLLQAQKMESIGRLAGGVAHDFNNLLTVINGYADLALRRISASDPVYSQIEAIRTAGDRAAELTMQLLAFSRKQVLQPKAVSLNDIIHESDRMLRSVIGEEIELVCILDPTLRPVEADPGQLHQVIVNLAVNAREAMPSGGKLIIETANAGPEVSLKVRDTGHGMDKATLEHVFEPFFTTKGVGKGTGLGLATGLWNCTPERRPYHRAERGRVRDDVYRAPSGGGGTDGDGIRRQVRAGGRRKRPISGGRERRAPARRIHSGESWLSRSDGGRRGGSVADVRAVRASNRPSDQRCRNAPHAWAGTGCPPAQAPTGDESTIHFGLYGPFDSQSCSLSGFPFPTKAICGRSSSTRSKRRSWLSSNAGLA